MTNISAPAELPKDFYVYIHRKASTGDVFYVGKGNGKRAWASSRALRSGAWRNTVNKHGLIIEIAQDGLQEWAAHELECGLIALHGRRDCGYGPLVNFTDGGDGQSGAVYGPEALKNRASAMRRVHQDRGFRFRRAEATRKATQTPEWRAKNAEKNRKLAQDPEWRARNKAAARAACAKAICCVETGGRFDATPDAVAWLRENGHPSASQGNLSEAARGIRPKAYGYTWKYVH